MDHLVEELLYKLFLYSSHLYINRHAKLEKKESMWLAQTLHHVQVLPKP